MKGPTTLPVLSRGRKWQYPSVRCALSGTCEKIPETILLPLLFFCHAFFQACMCDAGDAVQRCRVEAAPQAWCRQRRRRGTGSAVAGATEVKRHPPSSVAPGDACGRHPNCRGADLRVQMRAILDPLHEGALRNGCCCCCRVGVAQLTAQAAPMKDLFRGPRVDEALALDFVQVSDVGSGFRAQGVPAKLSAPSRWRHGRLRTLDDVVECVQGLKWWLVAHHGSDRVGAILPSVVVIFV